MKTKFEVIGHSDMLKSLKFTKTLWNIDEENKMGIRSQLFNHTNQRLGDDFLCLPGPASTHVLNAISPAFTASFALADLIIDV